MDVKSPRRTSPVATSAVGRARTGVGVSETSSSRFYRVICIKPNRGNSSVDSLYHEHRPGLGHGNRWRENRRLARRFCLRIRRWMERDSGVRNGRSGRRPGITTVKCRRSRPASVLGRSPNERSAERMSPNSETVGAAAGKGGAETTEMRYGASAPVTASVRRSTA